MMATCVIIAILALISGDVTGQQKVFLLQDKVYTYPRYPNGFENATNQCNENHGGEMAALGDQLSQQVIFNVTKASALWVVDYDDMTDNENDCTSRELPSGKLVFKECSTNLKYICEIPAWYNTTSHMDYRYGFSEAKMRYADARTICQEQGKEYNVSSGDVAKITSEQEQKFINEVITTIRDKMDMGEEMQYFINADNKDSAQTGGYSNWGTSQGDTSGKSCLEISDTDEVGKWKNVSCHDYKHYICKWPLHEYGTTTAATTVSSALTHEQKITTVPSAASTQAMTTKEKAATWNMSSATEETITMGATVTGRAEKTTKSAGSAVLSSARYLLVAIVLSLIFGVIF